MRVWRYALSAGGVENPPLGCCWVLLGVVLGPQHHKGWDVQGCAVCHCCLLPCLPISACSECFGGAQGIGTCSFP